MSEKKLCLNGEWDFMPVYGVESSLDLPFELEFETEKIIVPSTWCGNEKRFEDVDGFRPFDLFEYPKKWSDAQTGVYHRSFAIPPHMLSERLFLKFNAVSHLSRVYLNGIAVADWDEMYLPLEIDITEAIRADGGENELLVVCTNFEKAAISSGAMKSLGLLGSWFDFHNPAFAILARSSLFSSTRRLISFI